MRTFLADSTHIYMHLYALFWLKTSFFFFFFLKINIFYYDIAIMKDFTVEEPSLQAHLTALPNSPWGQLLHGRDDPKAEAGSPTPVALADWLIQSKSS